MSTQSIAFIGAGNMAASLIAGLIADGYKAKKIFASDPDGEKLADLSARYGIQSASSNEAAAAAADVLVLAVKPQMLRQVAESLAQTVKQRQPLIISIAAGIREHSLMQWLGGDVALIRTMPNTPAIIQAGATALHAAKGVSREQRDLAETVMRAVGLTVWVDEEEKLDAVTALSGSGPAYLFLVMELMEQAAVELGIPQEKARVLTLQTALGASRMAMESSEGPGILRERVTSPGGTTERALAIFAEGQLGELFKRALSGARERSVELSKLLGQDNGQ